MTKRHPEEVILARWTVDAARVQEFAQQVRARYGDSVFSPIDVLKVCDDHARGGLEVVCRDDAVFVGRWCLAFLYNDISEVRLEEQWLLFIMEGGLYEIPVPLARDGRGEAARMVAVYKRQAEEEYREAVAARQAPTWSNRLLNVAEAHWVWVLLAFFFVVIPAVVLLLTWLSGNLR